MRRKPFFPASHKIKQGREEALRHKKEKKMRTQTNDPVKFKLSEVHMYAKSMA